jgi:hypothetical protein
MIGLFLRSSGADPWVIDLIERIQAEGFAAFTLRPGTPDDPAWGKFGADQGKNRTAFWLYAASPTSRAAIGIFLEGVNDEILKGIALPLDAGELGQPPLALSGANATA